MMLSSQQEGLIDEALPKDKKNTEFHISRELELKKANIPLFRQAEALKKAIQKTRDDFVTTIKTVTDSTYYDEQGLSRKLHAKLYYAYLSNFNEVKETEVLDILKSRWINEAESLITTIDKDIDALTLDLKKNIEEKKKQDEDAARQKKLDQAEDLSRRYQLIKTWQRAALKYKVYLKKKKKIWGTKDARIRIQTKVESFIVLNKKGEINEKGEAYQEDDLDENYGSGEGLPFDLKPQGVHQELKRYPLKTIAEYNSFKYLAHHHNLLNIKCNAQASRFGSELKNLLQTEIQELVRSMPDYLELDRHGQLIAKEPVAKIIQGNRYNDQTENNQIMSAQAKFAKIEQEVSAFTHNLETDQRLIEESASQLRRKSVGAYHAVVGGLKVAGDLEKKISALLIKATAHFKILSDHYVESINVLKQAKENKEAKVDIEPIRKQLAKDYQEAAVYYDNFTTQLGKFAEIHLVDIETQIKTLNEKYGATTGKKDYIAELEKLKQDYDTLQIQHEALKKSNELHQALPGAISDFSRLLRCRRKTIQLKTVVESHFPRIDETVNHFNDIYKSFGRYIEVKDSKEEDPYYSNLLSAKNDLDKVKDLCQSLSMAVHKIDLIQADSTEKVSALKEKISEESYYADHVLAETLISTIYKEANALEKKAVHVYQGLESIYNQLHRYRDMINDRESVRENIKSANESCDKLQALYQAIQADLKQMADYAAVGNLQEIQDLTEQILARKEFEHIGVFERDVQFYYNVAQGKKESVQTFLDKKDHVDETLHHNIQADFNPLKQAFGALTIRKAQAENQANQLKQTVNIIKTLTNSAMAYRKAEIEAQKSVAIIQQFFEKYFDEIHEGTNYKWIRGGETVIINKETGETRRMPKGYKKIRDVVYSGKSCFDILDSVQNIAEVRLAYEHSCLNRVSLFGTRQTTTRKAYVCFSRINSRHIQSAELERELNNIYPAQPEAKHHRVLNHL